MRPFEALRMRNGGALPWTPSYLTVAPGVWMDDTTAVTVGTGASAWANQGSLGGSFTQATGALQPSIISSGVNRTLRFNGTSQFLRNSATGMKDLFRNKANGWMFFVGKKTVIDAGTTNRNLISNAPGNSGGGGRFSLGCNGTSGVNTLYLYSERVDAGASANLVSTTALTTNMMMVLAYVDWSATTARIYLNGSLDVQSTSYGTAGSTSNTTAFWDAGIAAFAPTTPTVFFDGDYAAVIQHGGALPSAGEIDKLFGWAAWRYGLVASLPVGHPYKSAPPTV